MRKRVRGVDMLLDKDGLEEEFWDEVEGGGDAGGDKADVALGVARVELELVVELVAIETGGEDAGLEGPVGFELVAWSIMLGSEF